MPEPRSAFRDLERQITGAPISGKPDYVRILQLELALPTVTQEDLDRILSNQLWSAFGA